jgi:outer membrane protein with beta-barrel domain
MRKVLLWTLLAFAVPATAGATSVGVGVFGGISIPVLNDLAEQGSQFGLRVPVNLVPMLTVEPFFASSALGEVDEVVPGSGPRDGGDVTAFGVSALATFGVPAFRLFPFVGIGSYKIEQQSAEEVNEAGYNIGLGLGISPMPKLTLDLRGEFLMIPTGETSRKFANVTVGASYSVFSIP